MMHGPMNVKLIENAEKLITI